MHLELGGSAAKIGGDDHGDERLHRVALVEGRDLALMCGVFACVYAYIPMYIRILNTTAAQIAHLALTRAYL